MTWAGSSTEPPLQPLDEAILFAPDGVLVPQALRAVRKDGRVVCGGIHMSDIPSFQYAWLRKERQLVSVANLTRADAADFFAVVGKARVVISTTTYPTRTGPSGAAGPARWPTPWRGRAGVLIAGQAGFRCASASRAPARG